MTHSILCRLLRTFIQTSHLSWLGVPHSVAYECPGSLAVLLSESQGQVLKKLVKCHMNLWAEVSREEHADDHDDIVCEDLEKEYTETHYHDYTRSMMGSLKLH